MSSASSSGTRVSAAYPLDEFYLRSGLTLPPLDQIDGEALPEPYKTLLHHDRDITSTLEGFDQGTVHLRVLGRQQRGDDYFREVVLQIDGTDRPVEFGAIQICLGRFSAAARRKVLEEHFPLGRILKDCGVAYGS